MTQRQEYIQEIRGIFDSKGNVEMVKNIPKLEIYIEDFNKLKIVNEHLHEEGFRTQIADNCIEINGYRMVDRWLRAVGTENSKKKAKIESILKYYC
jgi:hypothetical protein